MKQTAEEKLPTGAALACHVTAAHFALPKHKRPGLARAKRKPDRHDR